MVAEERVAEQLRPYPEDEKSITAHERTALCCRVLIQEVQEPHELFFGISYHHGRLGRALGWCQVGQYLQEGPATETDTEVIKQPRTITKTARVLGHRFPEVLHINKMEESTLLGIPLCVTQQFRALHHSAVEYLKISAWAAALGGRLNQEKLASPSMASVYLGCPRNILMS